MTFNLSRPRDQIERPSSASRLPRGRTELAHLQEADRVLPGGALGGYGIADDVRFVAVEGRGPRVKDESENWYIDYVMGAGAMILGHAQDEITRAIREQATRGVHFFSILNNVVIDLAAVLKDAIPCADKVTFTSTGSEATAYCLRLARAYKGRDKILKFEGAYHGNHDYSLISTSPSVRANYPQGRADSYGVPAVINEQVLVAPFNDLEAVRAIVQAHRTELAAIIVEPIQRVIAPQPDFLEGLRTIADANDLLLIFDEVVTGFRLAYGGAQEYYGVRPDLAAYGKIIGGGLALGAVAGREDILALCDPAQKGKPGFAYINGTLHGNPLASAAGLAALRHLQRQNPYSTLNGNTSSLRNALSERLKKHQIPAVVCGEGSMWHVLFTGRPPRNHGDVMDADAGKLRRFDEQLIKRGIFVLPGVRRLVSTAHGDDEFDTTISTFDEVCRSFR